LAAKWLKNVKVEAGNRSVGVAVAAQASRHGVRFSMRKVVAVAARRDTLLPG
jgi:hypothetical protein